MLLNIPQCGGWPSAGSLAARCHYSEVQTHSGSDQETGTYFVSMSDRKGINSVL